MKKSFFVIVVGLIMSSAGFAGENAAISCTIKGKEARKLAHLLHVPNGSLECILTADGDICGAFISLANEGSSVSDAYIDPIVVAIEKASGLTFAIGSTFQLSYNCSKAKNIYACSIAGSIWKNADL